MYRKIHEIFFGVGAKHLSVFQQLYVKKFVTEELADRIPFNESNHPGAHTEYIVAAARKSGLHVQKVGLGYYFYRENVLVGGVRQMLSSLVSSVALSACNNKRITKELLASSGVSTPSGATFRRDERDLAYAYFLNLARPAVVKPSDGIGGAGVTCGVVGGEQFGEAWNKSIAASPSHGSIIVEEYVTGVDVRAYVVGEKLVAAATRLPAFVIGDGGSTLAELLERKRTMRKRNAYLRRMPIAIDEAWIQNSGHTLNNIVEKDNVVVLNGTVNLHQGGEHVDVTDILSPEVKELAVRAASAIPGLGAAGIDLLVKSPRIADEAVVLEANAKANISVHHLPAYGKAVDVGNAIIAEMLRQNAIRVAFQYG